MVLSLHLGCKVLLVTKPIYRVKTSKQAVSIEQVLGSDCAVLCDVFWHPVKCLLICNQEVFMHGFTVSARQALVQSSSSSRARSKRVVNQTMFDVLDPTVMHVLLLCA